METVEKLEIRETSNLRDYIKAGGEINSSDNQRILAQLVDRSITACCSGLIQTLVQAGPDLMEKLDIKFEDLATVMSQPDYEEAVQQWIRDDASLEELVEAELIDEQPEADEDDVQIEEAGDNLRKVAARNARRLGQSSLEYIYNNFDLCRTSTVDDIEALEHWIVDSWFASKLEDFGEMVSSNIFPDNWSVRGRATSGQAISMDYVIAEIAAEMEILAGQKYEWTND